ADGRIIAYYCRKEHRAGISGFINTLGRKLDKAYVSDNNRNDAPKTDAVLSDKVSKPTAEAFVGWWNEWRCFAIHTRGLGEDAPLLVIIDGLDEAEDPSTDSLITVLPSPEQLPAHLYLVLTSRPIGEDAAPHFLVSHVKSLYATG
ncbi:MAG: hypothetical protein GY759_21020, partial [Chloroflexi bacterium]|nr:hypothetical protein [Chloroflexota bacterium]